MVMQATRAPAPITAREGTEGGRGGEGGDGTGVSAACAVSVLRPPGSESARQGGHAAPLACVAKPGEEAGKGGEDTALGGALRLREDGILGSLLSIWRAEGLAGLFRGCEAQVPVPSALLLPHDPLPDSRVDRQIFTAVTKSGILLTTKEKLFQYAVLLVALLGKASRRDPLMSTAG